MKQEMLRPGQEIVCGIDIMTKTIAEKAAEENAATLQAAKAEADAIRLQYEEKANAILQEAEEKAKKDSAAARERASSAAANDKRNQLLFKKGELVEAAFDKALTKLESLDEEAYFNLLSGLLAHALDDYLATERLSAEYEGEDFVKETTLSLAMAKRDLAYGKALADSVSQRLANEGKTMILADADDKITSGFVLVAGDIRMDLSLASLVASQKASLEGEVYRILFA